MTSEPRIIKYESDKFIEEGDYYGAIWESLKESEVLFNKRSKIKKMNLKPIGEKQQIRGKEMTSNRYVVLNCPTLMGNRLCYSKTIKQCADCTDCVIKQIYEMCKSQKESSCVFAVAFLADRILQLLDIEEIRK